jgi:hypothetical protein
MQQRLLLFRRCFVPDDTITRWTVSVSRDTDIAVRSFLAQRGMKKGDLSKFIEEAVKWRVLEQTTAEARAGFADLSAEAVEALVDEAVTETRRSRRAGSAKVR